MKDVRVDTVGELRCWNCGSMAFKEKRTARSKVAGGGVGTFLTKQKLKCRVCGEYNDQGNAKPYTGPASTRLGRKYGTLINMHGSRAAERPVARAEPFAPSATSTPAGWHPDPAGRHHLRWWDGGAWTTHVSTDQKRSEDPL